MNNCPACGGPLQPWREVPSGEPRDPRRYALARCGACASAVTLGDPPGREAYEEGVYAPGPPRAAVLVAGLQRLVAAQPVRLLHRAEIAPGARVLDAGAGRGRLVAALAAAGYAATGIEPSQRGVAAAAAAGLDVSPETVAEHDDSGLSAVVLWHVLEHLDQPGKALERIREWLAPGGALLVGVPNLASWQAAIAGERWLHLDVPRHRVHFTPAGLRKLLAGHGLVVEQTVHMVWEHNPAAMWMGLLSRAGMTPGFPWHLVKRNVGVGARDLALLVAGLPLAPLASLAEATAAAARRGGTIAVIARRGTVPGAPTADPVAADAPS